MWLKIPIPGINILCARIPVQDLRQEKGKISLALFFTINLGKY